jgi:hypothetical protein
MRTMGSGEDFANDVAMDVGEAPFDSIVIVCQAFMLQSKQM